jgi:lipopolysaccharide/colanic/teichoic acid biosynthesis glycosyltransferase
MQFEDFFQISSFVWLWVKRLLLVVFANLYVAVLLCHVYLLVYILIASDGTY